MPFLALFALTALAAAFPRLTGDYLGQPPPGPTPVLFAPGIVCTGMYERDVAVSPDGSELFFGLIQARTVTIMRSVRTGGVWSEPRVAPFAADADYFYLEPCISPDGQRVLFLSTRPPEGQPPKPGWGYQDIWFSDRSADGNWGPPRNLGPPVNTDGEEYFPSLTRDGTLYFTRGQGEEASSIWRARPAAGGFAEPVKLPEPVNRSPFVFNAVISPDEDYLVACVREEGGKARYLVFFRKADDTWSEGVDPGEAVNPPGSNAISPSISADGRYLFFASTRGGAKELPPAEERTVGYYLSRHSEAQNGSADIYWMETEALRRLRLPE